MGKEKLFDIKTHIAKIFEIDLVGIEYKKDFDTDIHAFKFYINDKKKILRITDVSLKDMSSDELLLKISSSIPQFENSDEMLIHTVS